MRHKVNRDFIIHAVTVVCAICFVLALFSLIHIWEREIDRVNLPKLNRDDLTYKGQTYNQRKELDTVLIMGLDKFEASQESGKYLNRQQADFLLLMIVDRDAQSYSILHLNRDTMTDMSVLGDQGKRVDRVNGQLALAHTYGNGGKDSCRNTVEAVSNLLHGVEIDHYMAMTMDGVAILNDLAGGVTLEIMDDFSKVDPTLIQGETMTLKGQQALHYVRARGNMEDSSNLHRMERQRQYLQALREQISVAQQKDTSFFSKAVTKVADYLVSDLTGNQMSLISERINGFAFTGFETLPGEAVKGEEFMEFYVDEEALMETVIKLFFKD